ncbi:class I SAM-dependent DNA methyltransferase [Primorskyibacter flagellatus]|uniref:Methyltransferase domain-containing protein n=1 Tax=Primorskyibacter flagellatus TaxID=1387277 RepID=A0A1W1ZSV5_9RHOB|nr:class I SAM-dependent methyltransferase [Primorskyibacter flagellatus]SMC51560.1 Methyltransferase domain-containing protein [Primorskyibacter flagellatus]
MTDDKTLGVYDEKAGDYARLMDHDTIAPTALNKFLSALPERGTVLDLGCGPGSWARYMVKAGFRVDAIDASAGMVEKASAIEGLNVWQADFSDIQDVAKYDGIWANFSLLHARRAEMPAHLARLKTALRSDGRLHLGLKEGTGEARDSLGRFYTYYTVAEIRDLLARIGLSVSDLRTGADKGLDGTVAAWFTLTAHG